MKWILGGGGGAGPETKGSHTTKAGTNIHTTDGPGKIQNLGERVVARCSEQGWKSRRWTDKWKDGQEIKQTMGGPQLT